MIARLILISIYLLINAQVTAIQSNSGIAVTWRSDVVVCPWLEDGSVRLYAGGNQPCRKSGSSLLTYKPNKGAVISLRDESGVLLTQTDIPEGYRIIFPMIAR